MVKQPWESLGILRGRLGEDYGSAGMRPIVPVYQAPKQQKLKTLTVLTIHEINKTPKKSKNNSIYF
jgi:hypothetical protein